jgi:hypothetical protein
MHPIKSVIEQYLSHYAEKSLPSAPTDRRWRFVLVIPLYNESDDWINALNTFSDLLVIAVVNHPTGTSPHHNQAQVGRLSDRYGGIRISPQHELLPLDTAANRDILIIDCSRKEEGLPPEHGVGLARKIGADTALRWCHEGAITGPWIAMTDADAQLPTDFFRHLDRYPASDAAAVHSFCHVEAETQEQQLAMTLYELRLHQYVAGLIQANSPHAVHAVGSCISVTTTAYAQVRGIPKRPAGEDFYLLNKLLKVGPVRTIQASAPIQLEPRLSQRTPFGTGRALSELMLESDPCVAPLFYAPSAFSELALLLNNLAMGAGSEETLTAGLSENTKRGLKQLGLNKALGHCEQQSNSTAQFQKQFHTWFDGFRTLKFIHTTGANKPHKISFYDLVRELDEAWKSPLDLMQHYRRICYSTLIDDWEDWSTKSTDTH